jgi:hypothetical protein
MDQKPCYQQTWSRHPKNRTIRGGRSRTHPKIGTWQYRRSQSKRYPSVSSIPPMLKAPLQKKYSTMLSSSQRSSDKNTKKLTDTINYSAHGKVLYCHKSHQTRHIQVDDWRWNRSKEYVAYQPAKKIICLKNSRQNLCSKRATCNQDSWPIK